MTIRQIGLTLTMMILAGTLLGCNNSTATEAIARREKNLSRTQQFLTKLDANRDKNLAKLREVASKQYQQDQTLSSDNLDRLIRLFPEEFESWEKKQPDIRRAIEGKMRGDVGNIEPTLLKML